MVRRHLGIVSIHEGSSVEMQPKRALVRIRCPVKHEHVRKTLDL
jgi:hypothetical protein